MALAFHPPTLDRRALRTRYRANRERSARLFSLVESALYEQPLELRHPFIFYLGHIPAFHYNTLAEAASKLPAFNPEFDDLFRRGIDPESADEAASNQSAWPALAEVEAYGRHVDQIIDEILAHETLVDPENPLLRDAEAVYTILEHEEMHQETLLYIVARLDDELKTTGGLRFDARSARTTQSQRIAVPAGYATIGARRAEALFGWDNEFEARSVFVDAFSVESLPVTNGEYLEAVEDGAPVPAAWFRSDGTWMQRTVLGATELQRDWPVYISRDDAAAFAASRGGRMMTEAEYNRAAYGAPSGVERLHPWGDAAARPSAGNFGFRRYDPEPVGASPHGASAWGIEELAGNGWEWTSTPFMPLPGFAPMASYPQYSADFFDGKHYVVKGASPVTATTLLRRSFRNWFRSDYPYAFTKFRIAYD